MKRIVRRGFPADTRCGSTIRRWEGGYERGPTTGILLPLARLYVVMRRSAKYLWIEPLQVQAR